MLANYPVLIIPAYNPDRRLLQLLQAHRQLKCPQPCIIVDDGSKAECQSLFQEFEQLGCIVLSHPKNLGKGAALKTAMNYYLERLSESFPGVITADADGQHSLEDILLLSQKFREEPLKLHLGVRRLGNKEVPFRSRFGNNLTKFLFNLLTGSQITDTQTGLRAIPLELTQYLVANSGSRYEFEFEMFFTAREHHIPIQETLIDTIYIENNKGSHFHPVWDSLRIYFIFLRFCSASMCSFLLDFSLFSMFYYFSAKPAWSVFTARLISSPVNFFLNKNISFRSNKKLLPASMQYFTLVIATVILSYYLMIGINSLGINLYISKIVAESLIYLFSFAVQYLLIFTRKRDF
nr:glycosyltransferase [Legionella jordanis]